MNRIEFKDWMMAKNINRKITMIHNHHTLVPDYSHFKGSNHFALCEAMKNSHMTDRRFADIAQQITTFPDGKIVIGTRSFERGPACIKGNNKEAICIEHVGNFDKRQDEMTKEHKKTIIHVNAVLNLRLKLMPTADTIVYHHWFNLSSGHRHNGDSRPQKSCPGTNFFGGNKLKDAKKNFIPKVLKELKTFPEYKKVFNKEPVEKHIGHAIVVRANNLNVRTGPSTRRKKVGVLSRGAIVDIYEKVSRWTRISPAPDKKWVSSFFLKSIQMGEVTDKDPKGLSVRTGPGTKFRKVDALLKGTKVVIYETSDNGWHRIALLDMWASGKHIKILD